MSEIYLIEDDLTVAKTVSHYLTKYGYQVRYSTNSKDGLSHIKKHGKEIDLIILDLILPEIHGIKICEIIRQLKLNCGIIILTQISDPDNIIKALDSGADDYLTKPFLLAELQARVKATLRRTYIYEGSSLSIGELQINYDLREVHFHGNIVNLRKKEFELLYYLAKKPNVVTKRDHILLNVWGNEDDPYPNTVDVHIRQLRKKFSAVAPGDKLIQTIHGVGYKLKIQSREVKEHTPD